jgi:hypothetical protein
MAPSSHLAMALKLFGHDATSESLAQLVAEMQRLELSAQALMRTSQPPGEFAALRALSDAARAAQEILTPRDLGITQPSTPSFPFASTMR